MEPLSSRGAHAVGGIAGLMTAIAPAVVLRPATQADASSYWVSRQSANGPVHDAGHARFAITDTTA